MDKFLQEVNYFLFYHWMKTNIKEHKIESIQLNHKSITYQKDSCTMTLFFWDNYVIEEQIVDNETNEILFYIHFEFVNFNQAKNLTNDFLNHTNEPITNTKVLIVCSCGITSSLFAYHLKETAKKLELNYTFTTTDLLNLDTIFHDYDCICLAPQIAYSKSKLPNAIKNKVVTINPDIYATGNYPLFLSILEITIKEKHNEKNIISMQPRNVNKLISS